MWVALIRNHQEITLNSLCEFTVLLMTNAWYSLAVRDRRKKRGEKRIVCQSNVCFQNTLNPYGNDKNVKILFTNCMERKQNVILFVMQKKYFKLIWKHGYTYCKITWQTVIDWVIVCVLFYSVSMVIHACRDARSYSIADIYT